MTMVVDTLNLLVIVPFVAAFVAATIKNRDRARHFTLVAALACAVLATLASRDLNSAVGLDSWGIHTGPIGDQGPWSPRLGLDTVSVLLVTGLTWMVVLTVMSIPRHLCEGTTLSSLLLVEAATIGLYSCRGLVWLAIFYVLCTLPLLRSWTDDDPGGPSQRRGPWALVRWSLLTSCLSLLLGVMLLDRWPTTGLLLVVTAVLIREGLFPVHSWMAHFAQTAPTPLVIVTLAGHPGALVLMRVCQSVAGGVPGWILAGLCALATFTCVYAAVLALGQTHMRQSIAWASLSLSAIVVTGLASATEEGVVGGFIMWGVKMSSVSGLLLVTSMIEARAGNPGLFGFSGLAHRAPRLAAGFLVLALASVNIPGTLGFIAEDIIHRGLVEASPIDLGVVVIAVGIIAIVLMRVFGLVFLGPAFKPPQQMDLLWREAIPLVCLVVVLVVFGCWPEHIVHRAEVALTSAASRGLFLIPN